jgi:hypothetical protein
MADSKAWSDSVSTSSGAASNVSEDTSQSHDDFVDIVKAWNTNAMKRRLDGIEAKEQVLAYCEREWACGSLVATDSLTCKEYARMVIHTILTSEAALKVAKNNFQRLLPKHFKKVINDSRVSANRRGDVSIEVPMNIRYQSLLERVRSDMAEEKGLPQNQQKDKLLIDSLKRQLANEQDEHNDTKRRMMKTAVKVTPVRVTPEETKAMLKMGKVLARPGEGCNSEVWDAFWPVVQGQVCVKKLDLKVTLDGDVRKGQRRMQREDLRRLLDDAAAEFGALQAAHRACWWGIVTPLMFVVEESVDDRSPLYALFVTDLMQCDLGRVAARYGGTMPEDDILYVLQQIGRILAKLHGCHLTHGDLKLQNVFVNWNGQLKLGDLGHSEFILSSKWGYTGTPGYRAPEMLSETAPNRSCMSDLWSLGAIATKLFSGQCPPYGRVSPDGSVLAKVTADLLQDEPRNRLSLSAMLMRLSKLSLPDHPPTLFCSPGAADYLLPADVPMTASRF